MKKVLTIVLSVAMVICLMPAMAFATDATTTADNTTKATGLAQFSDADSITNKEAVSVLTGLHIINGMGDGTFQPKGDVTRAQTATMISILVRGGDTASLKAPSQDPFTDVAKDNWAASYVAYGAQQGYINGMGDGTYAPDSNVTTAQMATILDQILGYSKADIAYQWPENAMAKANEAGLLVNVNKSANDNLDREEAAQMIFNALKATDVVKDTTTGTNGESIYKPVKNDSKLDYQGTDDETEQLVEKLFPKATYKPEAKDEFGRTATAWKNGRDKISDDVTDTPAYTYTSEQEAKDLNADLKGYTVDADVFENNDESKDVASSIDDIADLTGNGVLVELYTNAKDTEITKAIVAAYVPAKVTEVNSKTNELKLKDSLTKQEYTISSDDSFFDAVKTAVKGDRVFVAPKFDGESFTTTVLDAYPATAVKGVVSKSTDKTLTVDGKDYTRAAISTTAADKLEANKAEQTLYVDKYGYVADAEAVKETEAAKVPANYIYVTGARKVVADNPKYDPYKEDTYGKDVEKHDNDSKIDSYLIVAVDENGNVLKDQAVVKDDKDTASVDPATATLNGFYAFKEAAGGYVLYEEDPADLSEVTDFESAAEKIDASTAKLGENYISKDVKTITVKGTGSKTTAEAANGASVTKDAEYAYITKTADNKTLVTTIFVKGTEEVVEENAVYVVGPNGTKQNYTDAKGVTQTGSVVTYYEADSTEAKTMVVASGYENVGFYTAKANGDAFDLTPADTKSGKIKDAYNGKISIGTDVDAFAIEDAAVRDTRDEDAIKESDVAKITTVADLEAALDKNVVTVNYKASTDKKTVTELYITDVTAKAK